MCAFHCFSWSPPALERYHRLCNSQMHPTEPSTTAEGTSRPHLRVEHPNLAPLASNPSSLLARSSGFGHKGGTSTFREQRGPCAMSSLSTRKAPDTCRGTSSFEASAVSPPCSSRGLRPRNESSEACGAFHGLQIGDRELSILLQGHSAPKHEGILVPVGPATGRVAGVRTHRDPVVQHQPVLLMMPEGVVSSQ